MDSLGNLSKTLYDTLKSHKLFIICLIGLFYQTTLLLEEYCRGKTIVSLYIGRIKNDSLPSVTIFLDIYLSMERAAQNLPELGQQYSEYLKLLEKFNAGKTQSN